MAEKRKVRCEGSPMDCSAVDGQNPQCCACQLLTACREHVRTWEGVRRILASYQVDPGGQGQRLIKHRSAWAWECSQCGWRSEPEIDLKTIVRCGSCRGTYLKRVEAPLYFIAGFSRGSRNVFMNPYRVVHFVKAFYRWVELQLKPDGKQGLLLIDLWVWDISEEQMAIALHRSRGWVNRRLQRLKRQYTEAVEA